ncbi:FadR/GntR family transcriptional regulator [Siminovitchia sediminis]|uniref:FadR/GntR family transcriptional regulator n=1 Tax=Siminovitchia sediminis TaxID=1274353 RepID=A0ABW4KJ02_9BACI
MMKLRPIKKTHAYELVIEQIIDSIESGLIRPGDRLPPERELSEQLSTSRSVIREAMRILQTTNVIEVKPGIGTFLKKDHKEKLLENMKRILIRSDAGFIQLSEVRQGLEGQAAYLAAKKASEQDLVEMHTALVRLETAVGNGELGADEDLEFHLTIARSSQNKMLVDLLHLISDKYLETLEETRRRLIQFNKVERFIKEHRDIYNSIADRNSELARELLNEHVENTIKFYRQYP